MGLFDHIDQRLSTTIALALLAIALCLFVLLCLLSILFCRRGRYVRSGNSSVLPAQLDDTSCMNEAFDIADETTPRRIEQRRKARQKALFCEDTQADVSAKTFDRSVGNALAVEQLLRDSYVFDTKILARPSGEVQVIAAKRDYL